MIPVGRGVQDLLVVERRAHDFHQELVFPVRFIPMRGEAESQP